MGARAHLDPETNAVIAYEAAARVLVDLVRLGWEIREDGYGIELVAEQPRLGRLTPEQILAEKRRTSDDVPAYGASATERTGNPGLEKSRFPA